MLNQVHQGDCLEVMKAIPDGSVDMILCDLPYGTTSNAWDSVIPLDALWTQYKRIIKRNGAIILTAQTPFDKVLGASNLDWLRYEWVFVKGNPTGHLNAKKAPLKEHENVLVFYRSLPTYNPQMVKGEPYRATGGGRGSTNYRKMGKHLTVCDGDRYPRTVMERLKRDPDRLHPTQKPVALFEYLIKTYTNPGETVLDSCLGSGTTALAAINTGRNWIGIEREPKYVEIAQKRINDHLARLNGGLFA